LDLDLTATKIIGLLNKREVEKRRPAKRLYSDALPFNEYAESLKDGLPKF